MLNRSGTTSVLVIQLENVKYFQQNIVKLKIQLLCIKRGLFIVLSIAFFAIPANPLTHYLSTSLHMLACVWLFERQMFQVAVNMRSYI